MVCGTDGKTYASMCHLGKESCETKSGVRKDHPGPCGMLHELFSAFVSHLDKCILTTIMGGFG